MTTSGYLLMIVATVALLWDGWVVATTPNPLPSTESSFIRKVAVRFPSALLIIGYCLGHFFSGMAYNGSY